VSEPGSPPEQPDTSQSPELDERTAGTLALLIGRIASILGILTAVGGTIVTLVAQSTDITPSAAAILLGVVGYFLGARRLGAVSVVLGVVSLLVLAGFGAGLSFGR
jgi:hypothetical protein